MEPTIQLRTESIMRIPIDKYCKDFTFIVNGEEYHTSRIVADLLSTKISKSHFTDPTNNKIYINTRNKGDFNHFLSLQSFTACKMSDDDIKFISEIAQHLETTNIDVKIKLNEINVDNAIDLLLEDEKFGDFYSNEIEQEIDFISSNFSQLNLSQNDKIKKFNIDTIERILKNEHFQVDSEDEVLKFVNELYKEDDKFSILYTYVYFENVESESINDFINIFNIENMTTSTWNSISMRLKQKVLGDKEKVRGRKVTVKKETKSDNSPIKIIEFNGNHYEGIIENFRKESHINDEVQITASSIEQGDLNKVLQKDFPTNNNFATKNVPDSWICIEFKKHQIIPTNYTIRSNNWTPNSQHPRSWAIEGSSDSINWEKIDEQNENSRLKGKNQVFTFPIQNQNQHKFKYIRIRQTGVNWWNDSNYLCLNYIELFGKIY